MDLFLINGQDGPSLSEMVDCDIKSASDIGDLGIGNYFGLGYDLDLPSLDFEETAHVWPHPYTVNSNSSFELDFFSDTSSSLMVNPNSIMPYVSTTRAIKKEIKSEPEDEEDPIVEEEEISLPTLTKSPPCSPCKVETKNVLPIAAITRTSPKLLPVQTAVKLESTQTKKVAAIKKIEFVPLNVTNNKTTIQVQPTKRQVTSKRQYLQTNNNESVKEYPKPAYSYSCLIAMALKNSRSGSLPVSEIYSFMCDHFPYFKTAPNGWKNSVRHNLSLNKCFEKIEKPQAPGTCGAQRKGCLWAMNPAKIAKMDDEVAKWSRKDPSAIKKAMVYPENLELLERGEMKIGSFYTNSDEEYDDGEVELNTKESGDESEDEEVDDEEEDDVISTIDDDSEDEISRVPPSLQPFDSRIAQFNQTKLLHSLARSNSLDNSSVHDLNLEMSVPQDNMYDELELVDSKDILGLHNGAPSFDSESEDDQEVVVPVQKRPRIQGNYVYQPVTHINKHNLSGFRSITVENP